MASTRWAKAADWSSAVEMVDPAAPDTPRGPSSILRVSFRFLRRGPALAGPGLRPVAIFRPGRAQSSGPRIDEEKRCADPAGDRTGSPCQLPRPVRSTRPAHRRRRMSLESTFTPGRDSLGLTPAAPEPARRPHERSRSTQSHSQPCSRPRRFDDHRRARFGLSRAAPRTSRPTSAPYCAACHASTSETPTSPASGPRATRPSSPPPSISPRSTAGLGSLCRALRSGSAGEADRARLASVDQQREDRDRVSAPRSRPGADLPRDREGRPAAPGPAVAVSASSTAPTASSRKPRLGGVGWDGRSARPTDDRSQGPTDRTGSSAGPSGKGAASPS